MPKISIRGPDCACFCFCDRECGSSGASGASGFSRLYGGANCRSNLNKVVVIPVEVHKCKLCRMEPENFECNVPLLNYPNVI